VRREIERGKREKGETRRGKRRERGGVGREGGKGERIEREEVAEEEVAETARLDRGASRKVLWQGQSGLDRHLRTVVLCSRMLAERCCGRGSQGWTATSEQWSFAVGC
jgi:hypothetical protein